MVLGAAPPAVWRFDQYRGCRPALDERTPRSSPPTSHISSTTTVQNHPPSKSNQGKANRNKNWDEYKDPDASVEFFARLLVGFFARLVKEGLKHLAPKSAIYQWRATRRQKFVEEAWEQCGLLVHQTFVWMKARRGPYPLPLWSYEPYSYGGVEGARPG
jgi:hypothetical protein